MSKYITAGKHPGENKVTVRFHYTNGDEIALVLTPVEVLSLQNALTGAVNQFRKEEPTA